MPSHKQKYTIAAIICLAASLRILGIWHDYPYSFFPDEVHFVKRALSFGSLDFNPHWFHKPAFYMYLLFFEYGIFFVFGKIAGLWSTVSEFAISYVRNPGPFYILGRLLTTIFSLGSIYVVYRIGERHFKQNTGIFAALLLTLIYGHVTTSQDIKADTPAMFFTILSMFFLLNYLKDYRVKDLILSTIIAGIGTATKKYSYPMLVPILLSLIMVYKNTFIDLAQRLRKIILHSFLVLVLFFITFFFCSPYNFIDPLGRDWLFDDFSNVINKVEYIIKNIDFEKPAEKIKESPAPSRETSPELNPEESPVEETMEETKKKTKKGSNFLKGYLHYVKVLAATSGMGIIIASICGLGLFLLLLRLNRQAFMFLLYPVIFALLSVIRFTFIAEPRHQLPLYPFLAVCGGFFIATIAGQKGGLKTTILPILLAILLVPLYSVIGHGLYASKPDTRNLAKAWIESNIPAGSKLLIEENGPQLLKSESSLKRRIEKSSQTPQNGQFTTHYGTYLEYQFLVARDSITYNVDEIRFPWWQESEKAEGVHYADSNHDADWGNPLKPVGIMPYKYYVENGFQFIIVGSNKYNSFLTDDSSKGKRFPSFQKFYQELFMNAELVKEFLPIEKSVQGPTIKIFRLHALPSN